MAQGVAYVAGIASTWIALAWAASSTSVWPARIDITGPFDTFQAVHDTVPCSGTTWRRRQDDTTTAAVLARLAMQMQGLADSADGVLGRLSEEGSGAPHKFFTSGAEVARFAAAFGPDHLPTLLIASQVTGRASTMGEGVVDTVLAKRAECYAERAVSVAQRQGNQVSFSQARKLLEAIQMALSQERRNAEVERRRRP